MRHNCDMCQFYEAGDPGTGGLCRRYPPQIHVSLQRRVESGRNEYSTTDEAEFPWVSSLDWCGEWEKVGGS